MTIMSSCHSKPCTLHAPTETTDAAVQNLEVSIVGDFDPQQLEELALQLLGTLHRDPPAQMPAARPVELQQVAMRDRRMVWHLKDSDERADGVIAGKQRSKCSKHVGFGHMVWHLKDWDERADGVVAGEVGAQGSQARAQVWGFGVVG